MKTFPISTYVVTRALTILSMNGYCNSVLINIYLYYVLTIILHKNQLKLNYLIYL